MDYEILNDDLYDKKKTKPKSKKKTILSRVKPIYIHILLILIIFTLLFLYFNPMDFSAKKIELGKVDLVGELKEFNKTYNGNLNIYSAKFILKTKDLFKGNSKDFKINNFSGQIYLKNNSIYFDGIANSIEYDKNIISLNNENFKLISFQKTNFKVFLNKLNLNFLNGKIKLDNSLNYDFINSTINIEKINSSINYDGTFAISGISKKINLNSPNSKIKISFSNE